MEQTSAPSSNRTRSVTNRQLRQMGWLAFAVATTLGVVGALADFDPSDVIVIAFLTHAAACFSLPTVRNIAEGYAPNLTGRSS